MQRLKNIFLLSGLVLALSLAGCAEDPGASNGAGQPATNGDSGHDADGHSHAGGEAGHSHGGEDSDDAHVGDGDTEAAAPARTPVTVTIGETQLNVDAQGTLVANGEIHAEIAYAGGPFPAALRLWVGNEMGIGSLKTKADGHDDHFHGHVEVPASVGADTALWIEVETESGERVVGSVSLD